MEMKYVKMNIFTEEMNEKYVVMEDGDIYNLKLLTTESYFLVAEQYDNCVYCEGNSIYPAFDSWLVSTNPVHRVVETSDRLKAGISTEGFQRTLTVYNKDLEDRSTSLTENELRDLFYEVW